MAVANPPDVILISSDDEDDDCEANFVMTVVNPEIVLISSDDDGERNLDEGVASEHEAYYIESDEENDVEKLNVEERRVDNCDERLFNQGGNNLHAPSLYECKSYLRKHGMRVSGTKEECIQRIEEHDRLNDGEGESFYPKSSFSISCTGDACRGDVVLFKQNMYDNQRNVIGRRTVAGRIVKESYGASTEHTFSVEVLWSKRSKKLDPLSILLVKGRNLYRFGTFRQPWKNEAERLKVLEEKHERGKAARRKRKLMKTEFIYGDNKGKKLQKVSHRMSCQTKHLTRLHKHKYVNKNTTAYNQAVLFQNAELKRSTQSTYHSDPNGSMCSDHHLQEASLPFCYDRTLQPDYLPPCSFSGHSHHNNEQQGPNQALSQPPDHHHNSELPVLRVKDEKAKFHFPESSFSINCTGDARERDIVLFKQEVCLGGKNVEKRTVAGRIVKVRQCESRDKHKFLIKVLWTIPFINNLRRSTLLVRSRNLYKFGTFRQPWKNEAMRSKMLEEKNGPAKCKRKLKKKDIALNKNKGAKRKKREVSRNGLSSSKQPTQIAKHKSSKRKDASATPVKKTKIGSKRKSVQLQKTKAKKSKRHTSLLHPNPNTNVSPSLSTNPNVNTNSNPISSTTTNPKPSLHLNPNQQTNPNTQQNQNPNSIGPNLNPNSNPISSTTSNSNPSPHMDPKQHTHPNPCQNLNPHPIPNPNPPQNPNPNPRQNPHSKTRRNPHSNTRQDPHSNTRQNPNPHPTSYMPAHQLQGSFLPNQPPVWFPPNQQPFGFPCYGGQWEPNHILTQPPAYNIMAVLMLAALCYQQQ